MGTVVFENVSKVFDDGTKALVKLNLAVQEGEFLVVVGPSGCGKTTALRIVSGLEDATEGLVSIGGRSMEGRGPADRDVAMVFQNYALYPHMTVFENLGFGLRMRKTPKREIGQRVEEISRTLGLTEVLHRKPRALSGGQRQRVAMGRAIVRNPSVFLMDEPLSNLDAGLRVQMRREIARIQRDLGTTTIYVTHDQVEAMTMADRVAVMRKGLLQQVGAPQDVYKYPSNLFVASFIGNPPMNLLRGRIVNEGGRLRCAIDSDCFLPVPDEATGPLMPYSGRMAAVGIRPEHLQLSSNSSFQDEVHLHGRAVLCEALGSETLVHLEVSAVPAITPEILEVKRHLDVTAVATIQAEAEEKLTTIVARLNPDVWVEAGSRLTLRVTPSRLVFFDLDTGYALV